MVVRVNPPADVPARRTTGPVSEASTNGSDPKERVPFSRDYLDYWDPLPEEAT